MRLKAPVLLCGISKAVTREPHRTQEFNMREFMSRFFRDDSGATAIEYGLIAAGIAVAIIAAINAVGGSLNTTLGNTATAINP